LPEKEVNEINLKADKNNNNIPDWAEFVGSYIIVGVCLYIALTANPSDSLMKWLLSTAGVLAGGRDVIKGFLK